MTPAGPAGQNRPVRALLPLALLLAAAAPARAEEELGEKLESGWWLLPGINVGAAFEGRDDGLVVGLETSAVYFSKEAGVWGGGYVDGTADLVRALYRVSVGLELGYTVFGVDAGPVLELGDGATPALRVRGALTIGAASFYGGALVRLQSRRESAALLGILLKIPVRRDAGGWTLFF